MTEVEVKKTRETVYLVQEYVTNRGWETYRECATEESARILKARCFHSHQDRVRILKRTITDEVLDEGKE